MTDDNKKPDDKPEVDAESPMADGMVEATDDVVNKGIVKEIKADESKILKKVKIYSPFRVYFDDQAESISAVNLTGPFDILPGHKNFMTLVTKGDIVVRSKRGAEKLSIERGVMHVRRNEVTVFLDV